MKGYKAFEKDLTCRGFQYEVGKEYEIDESPKPCERGFHFCETIANCYQFYPMADDTRICEIEALGEIKTDDDVKFCTNKIRIVAEVTEEYIRKANNDKSSSGYCNSGNWNSGNRNSGDWNSGDWNSGAFNTKTNPFIKMFDEDSAWTMDDWLNSQARYIMRQCPYTYSDFVNKSNMTPEEIEKHPECETIGGYVKVFRITDEDKQKWWDGLDGEDKTSVMSLPNFDKDKFYKCTGIKIKEGEKEDE